MKDLSSKHCAPYFHSLNWFYCTLCNQLTI